MKFKAEMKLSNLNVRREKEGEEEGPVAVDLQFTADLQKDLLLDLFSTRAAFECAVDHLYAGTGELKCRDVESMKLGLEASNLSVRLAADNLAEDMVLELRRCEVNSVVLAPAPGYVVGVKLRVQCRPSKELLGELAQLLHEQLAIDIASEQAELELKLGEDPGDDDAQERLAGTG